MSLAVMRWRVLILSASDMKGFTSIPTPMPFETSIEGVDLFFGLFSIFRKMSEPLIQKSLPEKNILGNTLCMMTRVVLFPLPQ